MQQAQDWIDFGKFLADAESQAADVRMALFDVD
jgi:hypothetical protein